MDIPVYVPDYVYDTAPELGDTIEVAPGVHWLRMPLPFKLDHINLWLLEDKDENGDGWTIVDTGINRDEVRDAWETIFAARFSDDKPLKRVIVTHFHPDHFGLAGWLTRRFGVPLWMPREEWTQARMLTLETSETSRGAFGRFYHAAGFDEEMMDAAKARSGRYARAVSRAPTSFIRIAEDDEIKINGRAWRTIVGTGHSPEHACLYSPDLDVLISGDQVLPKISPNVSVWPQEPEADPLSLFLSSLDKLRTLGPNTLVLPSHNRPFRGLDARIDDLQHHHVERLEETRGICSDPVNAVHVLRQLFKRELDTHQLFFAIGETLAHLHYLMGQGTIERRRGDDGVHLFERH
ncbi:MAG: MBL fold metallo-hydrolase [Alphaproteobacteria bacterium]|jgi:glyoxylase-like metal-dependent hydrolase (beta-lactamase superfamily II)|nr:MBL fold metallo-hydrolase [Alphaproteobacteria bacterium]MBT7942278.1 MBL fold metallo-hydrolase [Alphaproteobacteria bacterium]